jgi:plastocyanin
MAALVGIALTGAACGDDGPDMAARAARNATLAAEFRAGRTTTVPPSVEPAADTTDDAPTVTEPPSPTVPAIEPTGVVVPVVALDNSFRPQVIEISVGDEVLWENRGLNEHNALSVVGDDWGVEVEQFQPGDIYAHVFTEPGEYDYFCSIHGNETVGMVGKVIVSG